MTTNHPLFSSIEPQLDARVGIIDIGSNSIRLVIYDGLKRAALPVYNEKFFCALGKGLAATGKLNPEGMELADNALARFLAMARRMDVEKPTIMATAAIRDASDGKSYVRMLERKYGISIDIISGVEEARLGAFGIFSSVHAPNGITGDLGGGSMEIVSLAEGGMREQTTLPIGILRLIDESKGDRDKMRDIVQKKLKSEPWLNNARFPYFYAIGGSFRTLAKMHMLRNDYPLAVLHGYTASASEVLALTKETLNKKNSEINDLPGVASKRAFEVVPASIIMEAVLKETKVETVMFSVSGIREGMLFNQLAPHLRHEDGLVAGCTDLATQNGRMPGYARELFAWMSPLFPQETAEQKRLRLAACTLSEIAWRIHNEYRAAWAFHRVLQSSLVTLEHAERVALGLALYHRHQYKLKDNWAALKLIDDRQKLWARTVGVAANLAYHLSGASAGNLNQTPLAVENGEVVLNFTPDTQLLMGDTVKKRLDGLGEVFSAFSSKTI